MKKAVLAIVISLCLIVAVVAFGRVFTVQSVIVDFDAPSAVSGENVLKESKINVGDSIFGINEYEVSERIESAYTERNIEVKNIERVFPNKIIFYIHERVPVFAIPAETGGYRLADIDFQLNVLKEKEELEEDIIIVSGTSVHETFNVEDCFKLKELADALQTKGMDAYAVRHWIDSVEFNGTQCILETKSDRVVLNRESITAEINRFLNK